MSTEKNKKILPYEIINIFAVMVLGILFYFIYEWSGMNFYVGLFAPINHSLWENLKLLLFPILLYSIFEYFLIGKYYVNFVFAKISGFLSGLLFMVIVYYSYTGIIGTRLIWADICVFILSIVVSIFIFWNMIKTPKKNLPIWANFFILIGLICIFIYFSINIPNIAMFHSP